MSAQGLTHPPTRILVTGGAGFIGAPTVARLLSAGHAVTGWINLSNSQRTNLPCNDNLRFIEGDVRDPVALAEATDGVDCVLWCIWRRGFQSRHRLRHLCLSLTSM